MAGYSDIRRCRITPPEPVPPGRVVDVKDYVLGVEMTWGRARTSFRGVLSAPMTGLITLDNSDGSFSPYSPRNPWNSGGGVGCKVELVVGYQDDRGVSIGGTTFELWSDGVRIEERANAQSMAILTVHGPLWYAANWHGQPQQQISLEVTGSAPTTDQMFTQVINASRVPSNKINWHARGSSGTRVDAGRFLSSAGLSRFRQYGNLMDALQKLAALEFGYIYEAPGNYIFFDGRKWRGVMLTHALSLLAGQVPSTAKEGIELFSYENGIGIPSGNHRSGVAPIKTITINPLHEAILNRAGTEAYSFVEINPNYELTPYQRPIARRSGVYIEYGNQLTLGSPLTSSASLLRNYPPAGTIVLQPPGINPRERINNPTLTFQPPINGEWPDPIPDNAYCISTTPFDPSNRAYTPPAAASGAVRLSYRVSPSDPRFLEILISNLTNQIVHVAFGRITSSISGPNQIDLLYVEDRESIDRFGLRDHLVDFDLLAAQSRQDIEDFLFALVARHSGIVHQGTTPIDLAREFRAGQSDRKNDITPLVTVTVDNQTPEGRAIIQNTHISSVLYLKDNTTRVTTGLYFVESISHSIQGNRGYHSITMNLSEAKHSNWSLFQQTVVGESAVAISASGGDEP